MAVAVEGDDFALRVGPHAGEEHALIVLQAADPGLLLHLPGELHQDRVDHGVPDDERLHLEGFAQGSCLVHGPHGSRLVRVDVLPELLLAHGLQQHLLNFGDPSGPAHQDHLLNLIQTHLGTLEGLLNGPGHPLEQVGAQLLELHSGHFCFEVHVVHQALDLGHVVGVGAQDGFESVGLTEQLGHRPRVLSHVLCSLAFALLIEKPGQVLPQPELHLQAA